MPGTFGLRFLARLSCDGARRPAGRHLFRRCRSRNDAHYGTESYCKLLTSRNPSSSLSIIPLSDYAFEEWYCASEDVPEFGLSIHPRRVGVAAAGDVSWRRS